MNNHFIFSKQDFLGEGTIKLSMSPEPLHFFTRWKRISDEDAPHIEYIQEVQIKGMSEMMINHFTFEIKDAKSFLIILENNTVGKVEGYGVINPDVVGWEFKNPQVHFQGFEFYQKKNAKDYLLSGEYSSDGDYRTEITGKLWIKQKDLKPSSDGSSA